MRQLCDGVGLETPTARCKDFSCLETQRSTILTDAPRRRPLEIAPRSSGAGPMDVGGSQLASSFGSRATREALTRRYKRREFELWLESIRKDSWWTSPGSVLNQFLGSPVWTQTRNPSVNSHLDGLAAPKRSWNARPWLRATIGSRRKSLLLTTRARLPHPLSPACAACGD